MQVVDACHELPVESYYDVAGGQPGALCRAVRLHAGDEHAALGIEAVGPLGEPQQRHVLARHADAPAADQNVPLLRLRSEEHTSELQSQSNLVCRLLLEKKKRTTITTSSSKHAPATQL